MLNTHHVSRLVAADYYNSEYLIVCIYVMLMRYNLA